MLSISGFGSLSDDALFHIILFVGKKSYVTFGNINRKCNRIFKIFMLPRRTFIGFLPVLTIEKLFTKRFGLFGDSIMNSRAFYHAIAISVVHFNGEHLSTWYLSKKDTRMLQEICYEAAGESKIHILENIFHSSNEAIREKLRKDVHICRSAASRGQQLSLEWLRSNNVEWDGSSCTHAAGNGHLELLSWLYDNGCKLSAHTFAKAVESNQTEIIEWLYAKNCPVCTNSCANAAKAGDLKLLKWLHYKNCPWDESTFSYAAFKGDLEMLKFLYMNRCPWDESTCANAAEAGNFDVLMWLHNHGCPLDRYAFYFAATNADTQMLKYLHAHGCPSPYSVPFNVDKVQEWLHSVGCISDKS